MSAKTLHVLTIVLNAANGLQLAAPVVLGTSSAAAAIAGIVLAGIVSIIHVFVPAPAAGK